MSGRLGTKQRALALTCAVCHDTGWVHAARVVDFDGHDGHSTFVGQFTPVPCFCCYPKRIGVLA